jgi:hypothetical protein
MKESGIIDLTADEPRKLKHVSVTKPETQPKPMRTTTTVSSFDFGQNATAIVVGNPDSNPPKIFDLQVRSLGLISSAIDAIKSMRKVFTDTPPCDVYLMEEQPSKNGKTRSLESAFGAFGYTIPGSLMVHVPVSRVSRHFNLPVGGTRKSYTQKKNAAVAKMNSYIKSKNLKLSRRAAAELATLKRKHDAADAVLQFLWWCHVGKKEIPLPKNADTSVSVRATNPKLKKQEEKRKVKQLAHKRKTTIDLKYKNRKNPTKRRKIVK